MATQKSPAIPPPREDSLQALLTHAGIKDFPKNAVIISEGDQTNSVYVIRSGKVKVFLRSEDGKRVDVNVLEPGDFFGEMVLDDGLRSASVVTMEPSGLSVIPQVVFKEFLTKNPDFAMRVILKLILRMRGLLKNVKSLALLDVYGRVARILLELAIPENGNLVIKVKPSAQNIAYRIGASREAVSRILKDLVLDGYIQMEDGKLTIARNLPANRKPKPPRSATSRVPPGPSLN